MEQNFPQLVVAAAAKSGVLEVRAPYDGALVGTVDMPTANTVDKALATAHGLFRNRDCWLPPWRRMRILERSAELMRQNAEQLALGAAAEGGKPLLDSKVEVERAIDGIHECIAVMRSMAGQEVPMGLTEASSGRLAFTTHEPIGVVVAVSAFNHPLNLIVHQVAPAVATGCPVLVKPAADTPLSCMRFVQILHEAGLPPQWCQALATDDNSLASKLVTDPRVAFFSFIGSAKVGWMLRSQLAPGTRCALEHGGAAPVLVDAGVELDEIVPLLAKGGFYHAGQVCVSVQRVFAEAGIAEELAKLLAIEAQKQQLGDPLHEKTTVGPLIRHGEVDRVATWVDEATASGAALLAGGKRVSDSCYQCTVLYDPPKEAKVSSSEIFGPVVCVYPYNDIDEALQRANSLPFAFQAAVFAKDMDYAFRVGRRLDASAVMVNDHTAFRVDWMPFAGLRQSGHGTGGIAHSMHDMCIEKMFVFRSKYL
ncbi:MAG: aldehyde dehydrogenase family protein [Candidatus Porifericomitaceae bacterium WSBS_2022_MAG_OTU9]